MFEFFAKALSFEGCDGEVDAAMAEAIGEAWRAKPLMPGHVGT